MSRYSPPPGRRAPTTERSSTSSLAYASNDPYYSRSGRDSYTQPRASITTSRVIPVSTEKYIDGVPVSSTRHEGAYDTYNDRTRRPVYRDELPERRAPVASGLKAPSGARSSTIPERLAGSSRTSGRDYGDYYDIPLNTSSRAGHKNVQSIDEPRSSRPAEDRERAHRRRDESDREVYANSKSTRQPYPDDDGIYEYMDPGRMYSETEPQWRPQRRGSVSAGRSRDDRRAGAVNSYATRSNTRGDGPPAVTRGLDKVNEGLSRRASLRDPGASSYRDSGHVSQGEDDMYQESSRSAPRKTATRADKPREEEIREPTRPRRRDSYDDYVDRVDDRRPAQQQWKDAELSSRGFGIRTGDVDPEFDRRDLDRERRQAYDFEPSRAGTSRRGAGASTRMDDAPRDHGAYDDRYERVNRPRDDGIDDRRPRDDDLSDSGRRNKTRDDSRRERDAVPDDRLGHHDLEPRRPHPRQSEREVSDEHARRIRGNLRRDDEQVGGKGVVEAAGVAAAGLAAGEVLERRRGDRSRGIGDEQFSDRETQKPERRRAVERSLEEDEPDRHVLDDDSPDLDKSRRRQYITKDDLADDSVRDLGPKPIDPDEEYRQRVKLEAERVRQAQADSSHSDEGFDRDRRRKDEGDRRARDRRDHRPRPVLDREGSNADSDSQALARYDEAPNDFTTGPLSREPEEILPRHARINEATRDAAPRGILRRPTDKFPEHPNQVREGVAPLQPVEGVPADARWTKINRTKVSPQTLIEANERYEERRDFVVVLRVVPREQIDKWAERTQQIRDERYERHRRDRRRLREHGQQSSSGSEDEKQSDERRDGEAKAQLEWKQT